MSWSGIVAANSASRWCRVLLAFASSDETSSSFTEPITLKNDKGILLDGTDENVWSKKKNGEQCHFSSLIEYDHVAGTLNP